MRFMIRPGSDVYFERFLYDLQKDPYERQNLANRTAVSAKEDYPLVKTFDAGPDFLERNCEKDSWFLQIESFSPHEPFMASEKFKKLYPCSEMGKRYKWPDYSPVRQSPEEIDQVKYAYFASLIMCDGQPGRVLDLMDRHKPWDDTMLIVNTDHGFLMQGRALSPVLKDDTVIREYGLSGIFGARIRCTDGRYVYMRAPRDLEVPLYEYTSMPAHMMSFFSPQELATMRRRDSFFCLLIAIIGVNIYNIVRFLS